MANKGIALSLLFSSRHLISRGGWELRRGLQLSMRRFGAVGAIVVVGALLTAGDWMVVAGQKKALSEMSIALPSSATPLRKDVASGMASNRARLLTFEQQLVAHEDIPDAVQELIELAEQQGLVIARAEYKPEIDAAGEFLRYRMVFPVKGEPQSVDRFIQTALQSERMLVLESVQFHRDRPLAAQIEARLHWALLTQLPSRPTNKELPARTLAGASR